MEVLHGSHAAWQENVLHKKEHFSPMEKESIFPAMRNLSEQSV